LKESRDKLCDIGEKVSSIDLVTITLNGMISEYQDFITSLLAKENATNFEELTTTLLQEKERRMDFMNWKKYSNIPLIVRKQA
jgi:hypothetical protein